MRLPLWFFVSGDLVAWLGHLGCCYTQVAIGGSALRDPVAQMKKTTVHVYLGDQIDHPSEKHVLTRLRRDLERRGIPARILANFVAGKQCRQIDLLIVTPARIVHCELKGYELPVVARCNGPWQQILPDGQLRALDGNGFRQALGGTYALSDDMRDFARRDSSLPVTPNTPFFKLTDTVVCIYPKVPDGSQLQRYNHVTVVGYGQLLERLETPNPRPAWTDDHWDAFVRDRGLYRPDERPVEERARDEERAVVEDYRRRFVSAYADGLHEFVPVSGDVDGQPLGRPDVLALAAARQTVVVVGPSGIGKTHLVQHTALDLVRGGHVVLWLRCAEYEAGKFSVLLARAVAPFVTEPPLELIRMAGEAGGIVVVVLDGLNECPEKSRKGLLQQLTALRLRLPMGIIITAQSAPALPEPVSGVEVRLVDPTADERLAILRSYGAEEVASLSEAFRTPFELAIAAECVSKLSANPTRTDLLDAYVRRRTGTAGVRMALRCIAAVMDGQLRTSVPVADVMWALQRRPGGPVPVAVIDDALNCPLLAVRYGRVAFSHESLARFLAAEDLVARTEDGVALGRCLAQPPHADLRLHAVGLERDRDRLRDAVGALADANVMTAAITGELRELARDVVCSDAASFLAEATYATISDDIQVDIEAADGLTFYRWRMSREWSREQCALLSAVGRCLCKGAFTEEVALLLDHTDSICAARLQDLRAAGDPAPLSRVIASLYAVPQSDMSVCLPASHIVRACDAHRYDGWSRSRHTAVGAARALAHGAGPQSWGRLYMATLLLDANDPEDAALLPDLLRAAWDAMGYHLRLQALHMVLDAAYVISEVVRGQVAAVLEQLQTRHLLLNSALAEAQAAYGTIEPVRSLEEIRAQIEHLLASEDDPNAWDSARDVVMSRLEYEELWGPVIEAIDELSPPDRVRLLVMAARGSMPDDFGTDWILRDLVGSDALQEPRAREVLIRFASCLGPARLSVQDAVATHLQAVRGCARFCDVLPSLDVEHSESADRQAWHCIDELLFELERERVGDRRTERAIDLWSAILGDLAHAAVDVIYQVHRAAKMVDDSNTTVYGRLVPTYRDEVRKLLEWGLLHRDELTSYFGSSRDWEREDRDKYIVRTLGVVGDASTAVTLRGYAGDPTLGEAAVAAIWQIERADAVPTR